MVLGVALATVFLAPVANAGADSLGDPFRFSTSGPDTSSGYNAFDPSLAYDSKRDRYLSVWCASTLVDGQDNQVRIWARFVGADGVPQGDAFAISDEQPIDGSDCSNEGDVSTASVASDPWAVYNPTADEYMIVWHAGFDDMRELQAVGCNPRTEIFGQRLSGAGVEVGDDDFRISFTGGCTVDAMVAYDATADDYLVVWGDEAGADSVGGQRLDSHGQPLDEELTISEGDHAAAEPYLIDLPGSKRFLVAWEDTGSDSSSSTDQEIHGRLVEAETGALAGGDLPIGGARAMEPALAFDPVSNEVLAVWTAGDEADGPAFTVRGQRLSLAGEKVGADFQVSAPRFFGARSARVAADTRGGDYQVVYEAQLEGEAAPTVAGGDSSRVYGQRIAANGSKAGTEGFPISLVDGDQEARTIAYDPARCEFMTLWEGILPTLEGGTKTEIFGRRLAGSGCASPPPSPPAAPAGAVLGVQSRRCASRRIFRIRIVERRSDRIVAARVTVNGQRAKMSYGRRVTARINLRTLPKGAFTVRITVRLKSGKVLRGTRRYRTCTPARNPHKRLKL
jgi:hypothetical protein